MCTRDNVNQVVCGTTIVHITLYIHTEVGTWYNCATEIREVSCRVDKVRLLKNAWSVHVYGQQILAGELWVACASWRGRTDGRPSTTEVLQLRAGWWQANWISPSRCVRWRVSCDPISSPRIGVDKSECSVLTVRTSTWLWGETWPFFFLLLCQWRSILLRSTGGGPSPYDGGEHPHAA